MKSRLANLITGMRIVLGAALLFFKPLSLPFLILYISAGITDAIDGTVARKTGAVSAFGSKFDTAADLVPVLVCFIKFIPVIRAPTWLIVWIILIAVIKAINLVIGCVKRKEIIVLHTPMNKITGILLFLLPLTLPFIDLKYSGAAVCAAATFAALQEGRMIITAKPEER